MSEERPQYGTPGPSPLDPKLESIPGPIHHYPRKGLIFERAQDRWLLADALERFERRGFPAPSIDKMPTADTFTTYGQRFPDVHPAHRALLAAAQGPR